MGICLTDARKFFRDKDNGGNEGDNESTEEEISIKSLGQRICIPFLNDKLCEK